MSNSKPPENIFAKTPISGIGNHPPETVKKQPTSEESLEARVKRMPKDVGVMLLSVGLAGVVLPGVLGLPFVLAGGVILMPKTTQKVRRSLGMKNEEENDFATRQITRFLDDFERRYPGNSTSGAMKC